MYKVVLAVAIVLALAVAVVVAFSSISKDTETVESLRLAEAAMARVQEGIELEEAVRRLGDAWHHATCDVSGFSYHFFFFGSRDLNQAGILWLRVETKEGKDIVTFVGSEDNDRLRLFAWCLNVDLSTLKGRD